MTDAWLLCDGRRFYLDANGNPVSDGWVEDADGNRYYMDADGNPVCDDWVEDADGNRWYLDENGICVQAEPVITENAQTDR